MIFQRFEPSEAVSLYVREYWIIESESRSIFRQKIIPDGYFELVFHYGDPYRLSLHGSWEDQSLQLFAGQITGHFYLENTGVSKMLGVKLKPYAAFEIFRRPMNEFLNRVVDLKVLNIALALETKMLLKRDLEHNERIMILEELLIKHLPIQGSEKMNRIRSAFDYLKDHNGIASIEHLARQSFVSKRQLERDFRQYIGLSPKRFARIIRFNRIFDLMKEGDWKWVDLAVQAGYFDQAHFIKDFKEFTGEEPSQYGFDERNMANFFLQK